MRNASAVNITLYGKNSGRKILPELNASKVVESWHIREMPETATGIWRGFLSSTFNFTASATNKQSN